MPNPGQTRKRYPLTCRWDQSPWCRGSNYCLLQDARPACVQSLAHWEVYLIDGERRAADQEPSIRVCTLAVKKSVKPTVNHKETLCNWTANTNHQPCPQGSTSLHGKIWTEPALTVRALKDTTWSLRCSPVPRAWRVHARACACARVRVRARVCSVLPRNWLCADSFFRIVVLHTRAVNSTWPPKLWRRRVVNERQDVGATYVITLCLNHREQCCKFHLPDHLPWWSPCRQRAPAHTREPCKTTACARVGDASADPWVLLLLRLSVHGCNEEGPAVATCSHEAEQGWCLERVEEGKGSAWSVAEVPRRPKFLRWIRGPCRLCPRQTGQSIGAGPEACWLPLGSCCCLRRGWQCTPGPSWQFLRPESHAAAPPQCAIEAVGDVKEGASSGW